VVLGTIKARSWTPAEGERAGQTLTRLEITAEVVAASLQWATASITSAPRPGYRSGIDATRPIRGANRRRASGTRAGSRRWRPARDAGATSATRVAMAAAGELNPTYRRHWRRPGRSLFG
jgi:hypothetical protein